MNGNNKLNAKGMSGLAAPLAVLVLAVVMVVAFSIVASASSLNQQPGSDGKDTYIESSSVTRNYGADTMIQVRTTDAGRALLEFNLSSLPSGTNITSAVLQLYLTQKGTGTAPITIQRMTAAWDEGTGINQVTGNGATWNNRTGSATWTTAGGDFNSTVFAATSVSTEGAWYSWNITDLVRGWVNGTYSNYGMMIRASGSGLWQFASSDNTNATIRPKLDVNYTDITAPSITSVQAQSTIREAENFSLTVEATDESSVDAAVVSVNGTNTTLAARSGSASRLILAYPAAKGTIGGSLNVIDYNNAYDHNNVTKAGVNDDGRKLMVKTAGISAIGTINSVKIKLVHSRGTYNTTGYVQWAVSSGVKGTLHNFSTTEAQQLSEFDVTSERNWSFSDFNLLAEIHVNRSSNILRIYETWFEINYTPTSTGSVFDGTINTSSLPTGVYNYTILVNDTNGNIANQTGNFTIAPKLVLVNATVTNASGSVKEARIEIVNSNSEIEFNETNNETVLTSVEAGSKTIVIDPTSSPIDNITFNSVNVTSDVGSFVKLDDPSETNTSMKEIYSIDPTAINFTNATVMVTATGKDLFKCTLWNATTQACDGRWKKLADIVPGQAYNFTLTPEDPGFGETNKTISVTDNDGYLIDTNETIVANNSGMLDINVTIINATKAKKLAIKSHNESSNQNDMIVVTSPNLTSETRLKDVQAFEATNLSFANYTITLNTTGKKAFECAQWNETTEQCDGDWTKVNDHQQNEDYEYTTSAAKKAIADSNYTIALLDKNMKLLSYNETNLSRTGDIANATYELRGLKVRQIKVYSRNESVANDEFTLHQNYTLSELSGFHDETYAIDPNMTFERAEVTINATSKYLYKCLDWNVTTERCMAGWRRLQTLTPGQEYTIDLTPGDPVFLESNRTLAVTDENGTAITDVNATVIAENNDLTDFVLDFGNYSVEDITVYGHNYTTNLTTLMVSSATSDSTFTKRYVIDPTNLSFANATITINATANSLYKCTSWNATSSVCEGNNWTLVTNGMVIGQLYNFTIDAVDPAFGEINITDADHLNESYAVIENIFNETRELDGNWSPNISAGHYVRVVFETPLSGGNMLNNYVRVISGSPVIELYSMGTSSPLLNSSQVITSAEGEWANITVPQAPSPNDILDIKVVNGTLQFDFVQDPTKTVGSVTMAVPSSAVNVSQSQAFVMNCSYALTGSGGSPTVNLHFRFNSSTQNWTTMNSTTALSTSGTNPVNSAVKDTQYQITVNGSTAGSYNVRCMAVDTTNVQNTTSSIQTVTVNADTTSPAGVTNLNESATGYTWIYWNWTNPADADFNHTEVWINGTFYSNVSTPANYYNATGLNSNTIYAIQTRTVDHTGNINAAWVNDTATTQAPPADTTPPAISAVNASIANTTANITWTTDEASNSTVNYGTNASLGTLQSNSSSVTSHTVALTGLTSATTYYYNVTSCDASVNCNTTGTYNFTTYTSVQIEVKDANNSSANVTLQIYDDTGELESSGGSSWSGNLKLGKKKIRTVHNAGPVKEINFTNVSISNNAAFNIGYDDTPESASPTINRSETLSLFAVDPAALNFSEGKLVITATGKRLYKCASWNFTARTCPNGWSFLQNLIPGENYTLIINATDPGFAEINITNAEHLNETYGFIENVYNETRTKDDVWSSNITANHYIRATFERNLSNGNRIDNYIRNMTGSPKLEIYLNGTTTLLGSSQTISSATGEWANITLSNISSPTDTFDIKVVSGTLQFDFVQDPNGAPSITLNAPANNINFPVNATNITLNATFSDPEATTMTVRFYGDNISSPSNQSLLYEDVGVTNNSIRTYNWTSPLLANAANTVLLMHLDNNTDFGESGTFIKDFSDFGNNATEIGSGSVFNRSGGKFAGGYQFSGSNGFKINVTNSSSLTMTGNWTIEAWIQTSGKTFEMYIVSKEDASSNNDYRLSVLANNGVTQFSIKDSSANSVTVRANGVNVSDNQWHYVVGVRNTTADNLSIYVDGVLRNSTTDTTTGTFSNINKLSIGARNRDGQNPFSGFIDEVRISNRSLSAQEIQDNYYLRNTTWYWYATANDGTNITTSAIRQFTVGAAADTTPPATVTNLNESSVGGSWIYWNWTNPADADFNHTEVWIDGTFKANVSAPTNYYNATGLSSGTTYQIQTRTVDNSNNINTTWVNDSATTLPSSITSCTDITSAGTYYLQNNVNSSGTCFNILANNVTLDCAGFSITGDNSTATYGIYSNQFNTTIRNCQISNFATGIYFYTADNGTIDNTTTRTTQAASGDNGYGIYLYLGANYNRIMNSNANASAGYGIFLSGSTNNNITNTTATASNSYAIRLSSNSVNNTISNSTVTATSSAIYFQSSSNYNTISNSTVTATSSYAIYLASNYNTISNVNANATNYAFYLDYSSNNTIANITATATNWAIYLGSSSNNTISNSQINGKHNTDGALKIYSNSKNNTIANNTINGKTGTYTITLKTGNNTGNRLINNTILNATNLLYLDANASSNTFYWNNFTNTSGLYVNDANGSNTWNGSAYGINEGNIWYNVLNGSVQIYGTTDSTGFPSLRVGNAGSGYPYNSSNSLNKLIGAVDYAPLTNPDTIPPSVSIQYPTNGLNLSTNVSIALNFTASDAGSGINTSSCTYSLDGAAGVATANCANTTISPGDGSHNISVSAKDNAGNSNTSALVSFTVDSTPPSSVTNLAEQSADKTWIYWNWTNPSDSDFSHTEVWLDGVWKANVSTPANYYNATSLVPGTSYEIQTRTVDNAGNINTTWVNDTATTLIDTQAPTYSSINAPADPSTYATPATYNFNITWTDDAAVSSVWLEFAGTNYTVSNISSVYYKNFYNLSAGTYNYKWYANDTSGNLNYTATQTFAIDKAATTLTLNATPSFNVTYGTATNVSCAASNAEVSAQLYRNSAPVSNPDVAVLAAGAYNYTCNASEMQNYTAPTAQSNTLTVNKATTNVNLSLNGSESNITITYPQTITATFSTDALAATMYRNGEDVSSENNTAVALAAGSYNYTVINLGNENYTESSKTFFVTVDKAASVINLTLNGHDHDLAVDVYSIVNISVALITPSGVGTVELFEDGILNTTTSTTVLVQKNYSTLGNKNWTARYNETQNYTSAIVTRILSVVDSNVPHYQHIGESPADPATFSPTQNYTFSVNWTDDVGISNVILEFAGTNYSWATVQLNKSGDIWSRDFGPMAAGTYSYRWYANDTSGNNESTPTQTYTIEKAVTALFLTFAPSSTVAYNTTTNVSCSANNPESSPALTRGGAPVSNPDVQTLAASNYNYACTASATQNYTSASQTGALTVNKATTVLTIALSPSSNITYGTNAIASCSANNGETTPQLYRNGTPISSPDNSLLAAGAYNYTCNASTTQNWTAANASSALTVNKAATTTTLLLNGAAANLSVTYPTETNASASTSNLTVTLYRNGTSVSNPDVQTLAAGLYNYTAINAGNENFTSSSATLFLTIAKASNPTNLIINGSVNQNVTLYLGNASAIEATINTTALAGPAALSINNVTQTAPYTTNFSVGTYECLASAAGNENYTANSSRYYLIIKPNITNTIFNGTNFSAVTNYSNISGATLEISGTGKIAFSQPLSINRSLDIDANVNVSSNYIYVNSTALPEFNGSATLTLYGLSFTNPKIMRDGADCASPACTRISYGGGTLVFSVTGFSAYSAAENTSAPTPWCGDGSCNGAETCSSCVADCGVCQYGGSGGSGGTSYTIRTCTENWTCGAWSACIDGKQTRDCTDLKNCSTVKNKPLTTQNCTIPIAPLTTLCQENWVCGEWSACQSPGVQTRFCVDKNNCSAELLKPTERQDCSLPAPSCFDGIRNQDEEDVDCGGSCQSCNVISLPATAKIVATSQSVPKPELIALAIALLFGLIGVLGLSSGQLSSKMKKLLVLAHVTLVTSIIGLLLMTFAERQTNEFIATASQLVVANWGIAATAVGVVGIILAELILRGFRLPRVRVYAKTKLFKRLLKPHKTEIVHMHEHHKREAIAPKHEELSERIRAFEHMLNNRLTHYGHALESMRHVAKRVAKEHKKVKSENSRLKRAHARWNAKGFVVPEIANIHMPHIHLNFHAGAHTHKTHKFHAAERLTALAKTLKQAFSKESFKMNPIEPPIKNAFKHTINDVKLSLGGAGQSVGDAGGSFLDSLHSDKLALRRFWRHEKRVIGRDLEPLRSEASQLKRAAKMPTVKIPNMKDVLKRSIHNIQQSIGGAERSFGEAEESVFGAMHADKLAVKRMLRHDKRVLGKAGKSAMDSLHSDEEALKRILMHEGKVIRRDLEPMRADVVRMEKSVKMPKIHLPFKIPAIKMPSVELPTFKLPKYRMPHVKLDEQSIRKMLKHEKKILEADTSKFESSVMRKVHEIRMPRFNMPKFAMPRHHALTTRINVPKLELHTYIRKFAALLPKAGRKPRALPTAVGREETITEAQRTTLPVPTKTEYTIKKSDIRMFETLQPVDLSIAAPKRTRTETKVEELREAKRHEAVSHMRVQLGLPAKVPKARKRSRPNVLRRQL